MGSDLGERATSGHGLAESAAVVLDPRLSEVWQLVWARVSDEDEPLDGAIPEELLAGLLRLAYLQGYADAREDPMAGLYRELGVREHGATT